MTGVVPLPLSMNYIVKYDAAVGMCVAIDCAVNLPKARVGRIQESSVYTLPMIIDLISSAILYAGVACHCQCQPACTAVQGQV